ncbi:MAG: flagellin [Polyangiales bacterium]|jgi:flagellin
MLSIMTNTSSLNAQRNLSQTKLGLDRSMQRLSSGLRINRAGDDAAGLAISESLKSQIRSLAQAERNANDGISLLQTGENSMNEMSSIMSRLRELAMQSATDTVGDTQRGYIEQEALALRTEIDRIATVTEFSGTPLIDGSLVAIDFQIGINNTPSDRLSVTIPAMDTATLGTSGGAALDTVDLSTKAGAQAALGIIDVSIEDISTERANIGAYENRLQVTIANLQSARENLGAANSRIRDTDIAEETAALTRQNILMQAGVTILGQANQLPSLALSLLGG